MTPRWSMAQTRVQRPSSLRGMRLRKVMKSRASCAASFAVLPEKRGTRCGGSTMRIISQVLTMRLSTAMMIDP